MEQSANVKALKGLMGRPRVCDSVFNMSLVSISTLRDQKDITEKPTIGGQR